VTFLKSYPKIQSHFLLVFPPVWFVNKFDTVLSCRIPVSLLSFQYFDVLSARSLRFIFMLSVEESRAVGVADKKENPP